MPRTTAENTTDIEALQSWQALQNQRNVKIDAILEQLTKQGERFELAIKQFQDALNDNKLVVQRVQDRQDYLQKVIYVVGSVLMLTLGVFLGQIVHFKPF